MSSRELFLSCCVLARQKHSSCELHFGQVASVLHGLLLQMCREVACKAAYRWSRKTRCVHTHATFRASLWPPNLGSLFTVRIWDRSAAHLLSDSFANN